MPNTLLLGVLLGLCPALTLAQQGDRGTPFGELDVDVDGSISPDEMDADVKLRPHFSEMDADHDGSISTGEFSRFEETGERSFIDTDRGIRTDSERGKNNNRAANEGDLRMS